MEFNVSILLLLALVASTSCKNINFGAGVGGKGHTTWGANAEGTAGLAEGDDVIGARAKARGGAFVKTVESVSGGAFVATDEGTGIGIGGTSVLDKGAGFDIGAAGRAGLNTNDMKMFGETKGFLDKEAHATLGGNLDFYDADKLKNLGARGPGKRSDFDSW